MIRFWFLILTALAAANATPAAGLKLVLQENGAACVRATSVPADFAAQLQGLLTNRVSNLVLDLRFADGDGPVAAPEIPPGIRVPVIVLVNGQTRGAAAELAAVLRSHSRAILIGPTNMTGRLAPDLTVQVTGEQERKYQENPWAMLQKTDALASTNALLPFIDHTSEADLVRRRVKDGDNDVAEAPRSPPEQPVIRDPALARALDLFKALAIFGKPGN